jgi:transposase
VFIKALRGWIRQAEADAGERDNLLTAELAALHKENAQLKRSNEVRGRLFRKRCHAWGTTRPRR